MPSVKQTKPIAYLCGPMTGIPEFNHPAFKTAAIQLRKEGYPVLSPAELKGLPDDAWATWMRKCIPLVCKADLVMAMANWHSSRGASLECFIADSLGIPVFNFETRAPVNVRSVLQMFGTLK